MPPRLKPPLALTTVRWPSPSLSYSPYWPLMVKPSSASLRMTFTTPAMASEPYWAEAPSRSTSTRLMAAEGKVAKSTPWDPWLTVPRGANCRLTRAERWRRVPSTSTRVWSGDRLRRVTGRTKAVPSAIGKRWVFSDGAIWVRDSVRLKEACRLRDSLLMTSIGDSVSVGDRPSLRVPVTTTSSRPADDCWATARGTANAGTRAAMEVASRVFLKCCMGSHLLLVIGSDESLSPKLETLLSAKCY